jgi:hypothetical protein
LMSMVTAAFASGSAAADPAPAQVRKHSPERRRPPCAEASAML